MSRNQWSYTDDVWKRLTVIKTKLVDACTRCAGTGYVADELCRCMLVFQYVSKLIAAGIPREYWELTLGSMAVDPIYKRLVAMYLRHIDAAAERSLGILFMGPNGVGKTALMCEIGKYAIATGYSVQYFTAEQYLEAVRTTESQTEWLARDVLLLDELGKSYIKEGSLFVPAKLEDFLRRAVTKRALIASTNFTITELATTLGDSVVSVLKRHLKFVSVEGNDLSSALHDDWKAALKQKQSLYAPNIIRMARYKEWVWAKTK